jgi:hypothetical protein
MYLNTDLEKCKEGRYIAKALSAGIKGEGIRKEKE